MRGGDGGMDIIGDMREQNKETREKGRESIFVKRKMKGKENGVETNWPRRRSEPEVIGGEVSLSSSNLRFPVRRGEACEIVDCCRGHRASSFLKKALA